MDPELWYNWWNIGPELHSGYPKTSVEARGEECTSDQTTPRIANHDCMAQVAAEPRSWKEKKNLQNL